MELDVTIGDLVDAAGTTHKTVWERRYHGALQPAKPGTGTRGTARYSLVQVTAIKLARLLDKKFAIAPADISPIVSKLWCMGTSELLAEFSAGRTCAVVLGKRVANELYPPTCANDFAAYLNERGAKSVEVFAISVQDQFNRVIERLTPEDLVPLADVN